MTDEEDIATWWETERPHIQAALDRRDARIEELEDAVQALDDALDLLTMRVDVLEEDAP